MKGFTKGVVLGRITEIKEETTRNGRDYITMSVDISGPLSGDVTAYCRLYEKGGNISELRQLWSSNRLANIRLQAIYSQYRKDTASDYLSSFTAYAFDAATDGKRRAYFIVAGTVSSRPSGLNCGGQRFLVRMEREGNEPETLEFFAPGDKLLPPVEEGQQVRVKGLVRQREPDGLCGSDGPIHAYLESLEIIEEPPM